MSKTKKDFWNGPLTGFRIKSDDVKLAGDVNQIFYRTVRSTYGFRYFYQYP